MILISYAHLNTQSDEEVDVGTKPRWLPRERINEYKNDGGCYVKTGLMS